MKLLIALLAVPTIAMAENTVVNDILSSYARQPVIVIVPQNNLYPSPPAFLPPVRGRVLDPVDFGSARLHETESIDLLGSNDE